MRGCRGGASGGPPGTGGWGADRAVPRAPFGALPPPSRTAPLRTPPAPVPPCPPACSRRPPGFLQADPVGDQNREVQVALPHVPGEDRYVAGRVAVAVDAAGQGAAPVEDLQGVEGDLLLLAADADDRGTAAPAGGLPGGADGDRAAHALHGDVDALLAGEGRGSRGGVLGGEDVVRGAGRAGQFLLPGETSTAMTREAPAMRADWSVARPTPPTPNTATVSPGRTRAAWWTAPYPVSTAQPSRAASTSGTPSGSGSTQGRGDHRLLGERGHVQPGGAVRCRRRCGRGRSRRRPGRWRTATPRRACRRGSRRTRAPS